MYANPAFKVHPAASLAFAAARGFGLVIACDAGRPVASHLPFRLIEADGKVPKLEFHVARANPLGAIAEKGGTWLVAVQGHDAYVSPDWYASAEQVPTWLYEAVHLSGPVRVVPGDHTQGHIERLSTTFEKLAAEARMEARQGGGPAARDAAEGDRRGGDDGREHRGQLQAQPAQVGEDHVAIANALARQDDHSAQAIAKRMVALRPHLNYCRRSALSARTRGVEGTRHDSRRHQAAARPGLEQGLRREARRLRRRRVGDDRARHPRSASISRATWR